MHFTQFIQFMIGLLMGGDFSRSHSIDYPLLLHSQYVVQGTTLIKSCSPSWLLILKGLKDRRRRIILHRCYQHLTVTMTSLCTIFLLRESSSMQWSSHGKALKRKAVPLFDLVSTHDDEFLLPEIAAFPQS